MFKKMFRRYVSKFVSWETVYGSKWKCDLGCLWILRNVAVHRRPRVLTLILENSIYAGLDIAELPRKVAELLAHLTSVMKKSYICQVGYKIYPRSRGGPTNAIATARKGLHRWVCNWHPPPLTLWVRHYGRYGGCGPSRRAERRSYYTRRRVCRRYRLSFAVVKKSTFWLAPAFLQLLGLPQVVQFQKKNIIQ